MIIKVFSEEEVHAEVHATIARDGYTLLCEFAQSVVHSDEEIETGHMEVDHPAEVESVSAFGHACGDVEGFPRSEVT